MGGGGGEAEVRVRSAHLDTNVTKHMLNNLPIVAMAGDGGLGRGPSEGGDGARPQVVPGGGRTQGRVEGGSWVGCGRF